MRQKFPSTPFYSSLKLLSGALLLLLTLSATLRAHAVTWFPVGPDGGDARSFGSDPSDHNHLLLGTATGWIYQSRDGGATWTHLARLGMRDDLVIDNILIDPSNPKHILAAAWVVDHPDGGLYESKDGGTTWKSDKEMAGQSVRSLALAPSNPAIVVAGSLDGVFRSSDGGETWARISPAGSREIHEIESLAIDPKDPNVIYAGTWHLPWKTTDGGEHWHNIKQGVIDDSDVFSIIVDLDKPQIVYASACSGIYKSENGGEVFRKVQGIPATSRRTRVLLQDPKNPLVVFAGTTEGLYRTGDGGATWAALTGTDVIVNDIYIDPANTSRMLVAIDRGGVLASKDGGSSFDPSNSGFSSRQVTSLLIDAHNPATMYVGVVNDKQWGGVFESRNGGITWAQRNLGLGGRDVFGIAQAPDGSVLAGTNRGIYKWKDDNWVESGAITENSKIIDVADDGHAAKAVPAVEVRNSRSKSARKPAKPGKKSSTPPRQFESGVFALVAGTNSVYAATSDGLYRSGDSGDSWTRLKLPVAAAQVKDWRLLSAIQQALFAADPSHLAVSFDEGKNWKLMSLPPKLTGVLAISVDGSGGLWVGGREGLFFSGNQGDSWTGVDGFNNVNSLFYDGTHKELLATTGSTMAYTIDPGSKHVRLSESGWDLRFVRMVGDHLIAATLFDGMVLQPRMVVSPLANAAPEAKPAGQADGNAAE